MQVTRKILSENRDRLVHLANKLIEVENLEGPDLEKVFTEPIPDEAAQEEPKKVTAIPKLGAKIPAAGV